jgi:HK97 family phage portal protein
MTGPPMWDVALSGSSVRSTESHWKAIMGIPSEGPGVPRSLLDFGRQPADEAWVFRCAHLKAMAAQSVPLRVEVRDGSEWVPIGSKPDGAGEDLQFLLDDVNPAWEGAQLQAYTSAGGSVHGGSYWLLVKGKLGGRPQEIHWLSGALVEPVMGKTFPDEYEYRPTGEAYPTRYPADRVIPFRDTVNLQDPYRLLSPLSAVRYEISTNRQAAQWNDALLRNWGIPAGAWVADPQADIGLADKRFIARALRALRGPGQQGKTPILPGGLKWQQLSMSEKDADWIASRKVSRMTIAAALGVPLVLAGDDEKASVYASTRDAERVFWRQTMINELNHRAVPINSYLVPLFDPGRKRLRVAYDFTGVEALRGAPTEEMAQWMEAVKAGLPFNRYIKQFGMGDPVEGGDEAFKVQKDEERKAEQDAAKAQAQAEAIGKQPKPEEYDTPKKSGAEPMPGGDRIRALGRGLYKHPTVRAFLESGDTTHMHRLVADDEMATFSEGLRRRYSVKQILDGEPSQHYPGIRNLTGPPLHLTVPVTVDEHVVQGMRDDLRAEFRQTLDEVNGIAGDATRAADAAVAAVAQVARIAEQVSKPRRVRKVPVRDDVGRIVSVIEEDME